MTNYEKIKQMSIEELAQFYEDNVKYGRVILNGKMFSCKEIVKEWLERESKPNTIAKSNMPKTGDRFTYNGMPFVILGEEQGGILAVQEQALDKEMPFDEDNSNDWRKSTLRKYLNEEHIKKFNKGDLLPFVSDLTADDGLKDYGTSEDYIFLLSCDLYRKYRPYMPKYNNWVWTITPWSCAHGSATYARLVNTGGSFNYSFACIAFAVAPACLFAPATFE